MKPIRMPSSLRNRISPSKIASQDLWRQKLSSVKKYHAA